jgi:hypothetical protein
MTAADSSGEPPDARIRIARSEVTDPRGDGGRA